MLVDVPDFTCGICGATGGHVVLTATDTRYGLSEEVFTLVRCDGCESASIRPYPGKDKIGSYYPADYYESTSSILASLERYLTRRLSRKKLKVIGRYRESGNILDVGCGSGDFLRNVSAEKWRRFGVEINARGAKLAARNNIEVRTGDIFSGAFDDRSFDAVTMWHVLEHVLDPVETLREAHRVLKSGGVIAITVPNADGYGFRLGRQNWFHLDIPRHVSQFNRRSVKYLLEKSGFVEVRMKTLAFEFPLDVYRSLSGRIQNRYLRVLASPLVVSFSLFLKVWSAVSRRGETIIATARKPE